jgi:hypothetical protein
VDLNLSMQPAYKIRGSLGNFVPRRTVKFELLNGDEDVSASRVSVNGDTGTFEIQDVLPGTYTVRATQADTSAELPVSVGRENVNGFALQLSPPVDIQIHQQLTNSQKESEDGTPLSQRVAEGGQCNVVLHPPGRRAGGTYVAGPAASRLAAHGEDERLLSSVLPGTYRAAFECYGVYARSVTFGTQDLLVNPLLTIQPGAVPPPIELVVTRGGGTVHVKLSIESVKKDASIAILLVPQFTPSTGPVAATADNEFEFGSLAPGPYVVYAFSTMEEMEFRNPAFLPSLSRGVSVQVVDNQEKAITIMRLER